MLARETNGDKNRASQGVCGRLKTMGGKSKINILMVDDEPGKLLSYEVMLG